MPVALDFTEEELCELWLQHTSLEDDPRDANNDLRVDFGDDDALRQELRVAPEGVDDSPQPVDQPALRAAFARVRTSRESEWSRWSCIA